MPEPLPDNPFDGNELHHDAYQAALDLFNSVKDKLDRVKARVLGYLMIYLDEQGARDILAREIISCNGSSESVHSVRTRGRTPSVSEHPSRPSFDNLAKFCLYAMKKAPESHTLAKAKALVRDNYRCVLTGQVHDNAFLEGLTELQPGERICITKVSHIIPRSTVQGFNDLDKKHHYAANVADVLTRFGNIQFMDELNGDLVHRMENVMTLQFDLHVWFDALKIWFEATDVPNQYRIRSICPQFLSQIRDEIMTLTSQIGLPAPDPRYLRLHAACAQVVHLSGAAEYVERVLRDLEEITVLAEDGGSVELLIHAFQRADVQVKS